MAGTSINLPTGVQLELALAGVIPCMGSQYYEDYIPRLDPIATQHGAAGLASFSILETNNEKAFPNMGSFYRWPTFSAYRELHTDPKFLAIKNLRDETMSYLSAGHFITINTPTEFKVEAELAYALVVSSIKIDLPETKFSLNFSDASPNTEFNGKTLTIARWSQDAQMFADVKRSHATIFKIRFNATLANQIRKISK